MQITQLPPIPVNVPGGQIVHIAAQRWALEPWTGEPDPPDLGKSRSCLPAVAVRENFWGVRAGWGLGSLRWPGRGWMGAGCP
jgi:hypothetical protein